MFHYIDLDNLQKYFDDAGIDRIAPVDYEGTFTNVTGNYYNFVTRSPGTFNIQLLKDDTYAIVLNGNIKLNLKYDENNRSKVEQLQ